MLDSLQSDDHCKAGAGGQVRRGGDEACARAVPAGGGDAGATGATIISFFLNSFSSNKFAFEFHVKYSRSIVRGDLLR